MIRNTEIDRLRALAVVGTVFAHLPDLWMWKVPLIEFLRRYAMGNDGVLLFFTISGFVISSSLIPKLDKALSSGTSVIRVLAAFFCKRLYRITPTASLWVVITLIVTAVVDPSGIVGNVYGALAALFNFFNVYVVLPGARPNLFGVYWSLSLEEQFYVVLPIILLLFRVTWGRVTVLVGLMLVAEFVKSPIINAFPMQPIIAGVLLYIVNEKYSIFDKLGKSTITAKPVLVPLAWFLSILIFILPIFRYALPHYLMVFSLVCTLLVCVAALGKGSVLNVRGSSAILEWLGSRSFTLYLTHFPMLLIVRHFWMATSHSFGFSYSQHYNFSIFVTWLVVTLVVTEFSYRFFEQPILTKGRELAGRIEGKPGGYFESFNATKSATN